MRRIFRKLSPRLSHRVPTPAPKKRTYRRFRRAHIGELWEEQHLRRTARLGPIPPLSLLDLRFSLRATRKVHTAP